jgi:hypothetical protein
MDIAAGEGQFFTNFLKNTDMNPIQNVPFTYLEGHSTLWVAMFFPPGSDQHIDATNFSIQPEPGSSNRMTITVNVIGNGSQNVCGYDALAINIASYVNDSKIFSAVTAVNKGTTSSATIHVDSGYIANIFGTVHNLEYGMLAILKSIFSNFDTGYKNMVGSDMPKAISDVKQHIQHKMDSLKEAK